MKNRIEEIRIGKGITLETMEQETGISGQQISRVSKGQRRLYMEFLERVAPSLGCKIIDLLPEEVTGLSDEKSEMLRIMNGLDKEAEAALLSIARQVSSKQNAG